MTLRFTYIPNGKRPGRQFDVNISVWRAADEELVDGLFDALTASSKAKDVQLLRRVESTEVIRG
jgi:hypothetical protein